MMDFKPSHSVGGSVGNNRYKICPHLDQIKYVVDLLRPLAIPEPTDALPVGPKDGFCGWRIEGSHTRRFYLVPKRYCVVLCLAAANALWLADQTDASQHDGICPSKEAQKKADRVILASEARTLCNRLGLLEHWRSMHNVQDQRFAREITEGAIEALIRTTCCDPNNKQLPPNLVNLRLPGLFEWSNLQGMASNLLLNAAFFHSTRSGCLEKPTYPTKSRTIVYV